jgi:hypothetical protein
MPDGERISIEHQEKKRGIKRWRTQRVESLCAPPASSLCDLQRFISSIQALLFSRAIEKFFATKRFLAVFSH